MWFLRRTHHSRVTESSCWERDGCAYLLLEEARLRCEALREASSGAQRDALHRLHREIGRAGLLASARIPTYTRHELLAQARVACAGATADRREATRALVLVVGRAQRAVERALGPPELSDHIGRARRHVLGALELLEGEAVRAVAGDFGSPRLMSPIPATPPTALSPRNPRPTSAYATRSLFAREPAGSRDDDARECRSQAGKKE